MTVSDSIKLTDIVYDINQRSAPYLLFYRNDNDELEEIIDYKYDPKTKGCQFTLVNSSFELSQWEFELLDSERIELYKLTDINKYKWER